MEPTEIILFSVSPSYVPHSIIVCRPQDSVQLVMHQGIIFPLKISILLSLWEINGPVSQNT